MNFSTVKEDFRVVFVERLWSNARICCEDNLIEVDKSFWEKCSDLEKIEVIESLRFIKQNPECQVTEWK